jgi:hypothetical protein
MKRKRNKKAGPGAGVLITRWCARLTSLAGLAIMVYFIIYRNLNPAHLPKNELLLFMCMPVGVGLGYLISWGWEGAGAVVSLVCLACFYLLYYFLTGNINLDFLVFILPPLLFLLSRFVASRK